MGPPGATGWPAVERGEGSPVVFLHGYPLDHRMWRPQLEALSRNHRVVLLDLPGFGRAAESRVPDTLSGFSAEVARGVSAHVSGPAVVVGHSFGGYIALQLFRDHPELFAGLVLADTRSEPDTAEAREKRLATVRRSAETGEGVDVEATTRALLAPSTWKAGGPLVEGVRAIVRSARPPSIRGALTAIATRPDLTDTLSKVNVPSLVIWGEEDQLIPPSQTRALVTHLPRGSGVGIRGAGHLPSLEAPDPLIEALVDFLARLSRG